MKTRPPHGPRRNPRAARHAIAGAALLACLVPPVAHAQGLRTLYEFESEPDGSEPGGGPTFFNGALYGTTMNGGPTDQGAIYRVDAKTGAETIIHAFSGADGVAPEGELLIHHGVIYGTASFGGALNGGTVFKADPETGATTVLHSFGDGADGTGPAAGVIYDNGFVYGTTTQGGTAGLGIVFAVNVRTGVETVLHNFAGGASDGSVPFTPLTLANGALYGTTFFGGPSNTGTVFKIDPHTGDESVIHAFGGQSFTANPAAGLTFANNVLYGTTAHGGSKKCDGSGCGTVFSIDPASAAFTTLYTFADAKDGQDPEGGLAYFAGGLYGTTEEGGHAGRGTAFRVDATTGVETRLHVFDRPNDGATPMTLIVHGGKLYGTTRSGGGGFGTVFSLKP